MKRITSTYYFLAMALIATLGISCVDDPTPPPEDDGDLTNIAYEPTAFTIEYPLYTQLIGEVPVIVPQMPIPSDNEMTDQGIELGRHLFYDKILSADNTQSCASCHLPEGSFTDNRAVSVGIDGVAGSVSSMSLLNVGFYNNGLFWDGRVTTLEEQALLPVEDPIELHHTWPEVITELRSHETYPKMFREAFGIANKSDITRELAAKAIAQFERSIYSFESKFDQFMRGETTLSDDELEGFSLFVDLDDRAHCAHCHNLPLITSNEYFNNGLQEAATFADFKDKGRGLVTSMTENGFFRAPTVRNIELTAPYMHDGSLQTLEEVMDHYGSGGKPSISRDPSIASINLDDYDKQVLVAFMKTLTDHTVVNEERLQNPF